MRYAVKCWIPQLKSWNLHQKVELCVKIMKFALKYCAPKCWNHEICTRMLRSADKIMKIALMLNSAVENHEICIKCWFSKLKYSKMLNAQSKSWN